MFFTCVADLGGTSKPDLELNNIGYLHIAYQIEILLVTLHILYPLWTVQYPLENKLLLLIRSLLLIIHLMKIVTFSYLDASVDGQTFRKVFVDLTTFETGESIFISDVPENHLNQECVIICANRNFDGKPQPFF